MSFKGMLWTDGCRRAPKVTLVCQVVPYDHSCLWGLTCTRLHGAVHTWGWYASPRPAHAESCVKPGKRANAALPGASSKGKAPPPYKLEPQLTAVEWCGWF